MSIEVGGTFGISFVWWDKTQRWHIDCMGAKKKQGSSVMYWGMIGYGWKGPFHVWDPKTEEEKREAESISKMYFSRWEPPGVSERMWSVNLEASISGDYQTLGGHSGRPSE